MTSVEVAAAAGVSRSLVMTLARNGKLPGCTKDSLSGWSIPVASVQTLKERKAMRHGFSRNSDRLLYKTWVAIRARCHDEKNLAYKNYGGRGIFLFEAWRDRPHEFLEYVKANLGLRPVGKTLDRKNNSLGYQPGNLRWATDGQQMRNTRRNRLLTVDGRTMTCTDWALEKGVDTRLIWMRLKMGWSQEDAVNKPVARKSKK